jgi:hypothetical protein
MALRSLLLASVLHVPASGSCAGLESCRSCSSDCLPTARIAVLLNVCFSFVVCKLFMCACFFCLSLLWLFSMGFNPLILKWMDLVGEIFVAGGWLSTAPIRFL